MDEPPEQPSTRSPSPWPRRRSSGLGPSGEVLKNPETINYRTFKPEKGGLFCERIFGPTRDWECACGKYKRIKHKGVVCDRCGVEVTLSRVRRERMGHIELGCASIPHLVLQVHAQPHRPGAGHELPASLSASSTTRTYVVTDVRAARLLELGQLLSESGNPVKRKTPTATEPSKPEMGAEAHQWSCSQEIDLAELTRRGARGGDCGTTQAPSRHKKKLAKRLKLAQRLRGNARRALSGWIMHVLPVIPPDLRPLVPLEGGRFATSDLNDLYRRVINRNNRLEEPAPAQDPGSDYPEREAHAAGGRGRAV